MRSSTRRAFTSHKVNESLDNLVKGKIEIKHPEGREPQHLAFV